MKRFLVFGGEHYYPSGGWSDFQGAFDTLENAQANLSCSEDGTWYFRNDEGHGCSIEWWQVVDSKTLEKVASHNDDHEWVTYEKRKPWQDCQPRL